MCYQIHESFLPARTFCRNKYIEENQTDLLQGGLLDSKIVVRVDIGIFYGATAKRNRMIRTYHKI